MRFQHGENGWDVFQHGENGWDVFVASLSPAELERERMRPPKPGERPGSQADRAMRQAHEWAVQARRRRREPEPIGDVEFAAVLAEAQEYDVAAGRVRPRLAASRTEMGRKAS